MRAFRRLFFSPVVQSNSDNRDRTADGPIFTLSEWLFVVHIVVQ